MIVRRGGAAIVEVRIYRFGNDIIGRGRWCGPLEVKQYRWKRRPPINEDTHNEDTQNNQPGTDDDNGG